MTRRLIREGDPPAGQLASPVPQYWNPNTEAFEDVLGAHGAPRAILYGPNGQPIGSSNPLPVADSALAQAVAQLATEGKLEEARALLETISQKDFATQTTLSEVLQRLEAIEEQLETGDAKVQLKGSDESIPVQIESRNTPLWSGSRKYPVPLKVSKDESQKRNDHIALWDKDGRLFGRSFTGNQVWYSDDGWRTQKPIRFMDEGFFCRGIVAVSRDKVLVDLNHDTDPNLAGLYVIDNIEAPKEEQRFEKVLGWERTSPHEMFGYDVYPYHGESRIILATEYAVTSDPNWGRHVHLSTDGGETWRTIFELPELVPGSTHIHSAHYDAYADRIWIVSGDAGATNVFYSDDWASPAPTWKTVWSHGEAPIQFTSVWSTPTHVFFATDRASQQGIWSYERNPVNVRETPTIRPHFIVAEGGLTRAGGNFRPTPDGLGAYVVLRGAAANIPAHILGTRDGVTWYELYHKLRQDTPGYWQQPMHAFEVNGELIYWQDGEIIRSKIAWETR